MGVVYTKTAELPRARTKGRRKTLLRKKKKIPNAMEKGRAGSAFLKTASSSSVQNRPCETHNRWVEGWNSSLRKKGGGTVMMAMKHVKTVSQLNMAARPTSTL